MKKFIISSVLFLLFFLTVDKFLLLVRNTSPDREIDRRIEKILNGQVNEDLIILGSSRGARSIIAKVFTDSLSLSAYNFSYPGSDIIFHEYLLRLILKNNQKNKLPKSLILVVDDSDELKESKNLIFRLDRLYPLVKYKDVRDELVERKEKKWLINELLISHQLNKSNFLFKNRRFTKNDTIMPCGSMPISHQKETFDKKYNYSIYNYTEEAELPQKIDAFKSIIKMCKENSINLIVAIPPNFKILSQGFSDRLKRLLNGYGQIWTYDANNPIYLNSDYYFDNAHLQTRGSYFYTNELVSWYDSVYR